MRRSVQHEHVGVIQNRISFPLLGLTRRSTDIYHEQQERCDESTGLGVAGIREVGEDGSDEKKIEAS